MNIKAMIMAREDPALSCSSRSSPMIGNQPAPAPQKRDTRAGMTRIQLSHTHPLPQPPFPRDSSQASQSEAAVSTREGRSRSYTTNIIPTTITSTTSTTSTTATSSNSNNGRSHSSCNSSHDSVDLGMRSSRRRNVGEALVASQFADPLATPPSTPLFMQAFEDPTSSSSSLSICPPAQLSTDAAADASSNPDTDTNTQLNTTNTTQDTQASSSSSSSSSPSGQGSAAIAIPRPSPLDPHSTTLQGHEDGSRMSASSSPKKTTSSTLPRSPPAAASAFLAALEQQQQQHGQRQEQQQQQQRPRMTARRHTTSSPSPSSSSLVSPPHVPLRQANPTLRQLQTPQIPMNLVQARILQQEEQKRRDEELAKIPITANLRTVKKIQAVMMDDEEEAPAASPSTSSSDSTSTSTGPKTRPRSKTATASSLMGLGGKQRGDRDHVEPVVIPKKLAETVGNILGRKLAGKGCTLEDRQLEEEARKEAEPLPPIVRGQPRKRAVTSSHIRNLVSSWDHKVEVAKEITQEAEQVRLFLEERSSAHVEMPKVFKKPIPGDEFLKPLPALPAPPPGELIRKNSRRAGGGRTRSATHTNPYASSGHGSSSSSSSLLSSEDLLNTSIPEEDPSVLEELKAETADKVETTTLVVPSRQPTIAKPEESETKRSGQLLDNSAHLSRPRRKGVRRPTATQ
ncbi:MAG: hypothetical protein J3Q66DRAFT_343029 [Benniella sp.]|nr:MAG: hypothetical protein J3Q66DRAFT_343029 [Benniella sp.]